MAHKKAGGTVYNTRDSESKRLGVKIFGGSPARSGNIIIRQKGNKYWPDQGVAQGKDFTIFATRDGVVNFQEKKRVRFDGRVYRDKYVSII